MANTLAQCLVVVLQSMIKAIARSFIVSLALGLPTLLHAQTIPPVLVNEYYNAGQNEEWTEILILQDNYSLIGAYFGDNNQATNSWQPVIQFNSIAQWRNLRRGTWIIIHHATQPGDCSNSYRDLDGSDGFIEVCAKDPFAFTGGIPSNTLNIASDGDFLHLVAQNGQHLVGLGHDPNPGNSVEGGGCVNNSSSWTNTTSAESDTRPCGRFFFVRAKLVNNQSLQYIKGEPTELRDNAGTFFDSTNTTLARSPNSTLGLGNSPLNTAYAVDRRTPEWRKQVVCLEALNSGNRISWQQFPNPYRTDGVTKLLVTRGSSTAPPPVDGRAYTVGSTLGSGTSQATVLAILDDDATQYTDASPFAIDDVYRIYVYRFGITPGLSGQPAERGPAYNDTAYVEAAPFQTFYTLQYPTAVCPNDTFQVSLRDDDVILDTWDVAYFTDRPAYVSSDTPIGIALTVQRSQQGGRDSLVFQTNASTSSPCGPVVNRAATPLIAPVDIISYRDTTLEAKGLFCVALNRDTAFGVVYQSDPAPGTGQFPNPCYQVDTSRTVFFSALRSRSSGCASRDTLVINYAPPIPPAIDTLPPNLLTTMQADGVNDVFKFRLQGQVKDMEIFNRWGKRVHKAGDYTNYWKPEAPGTYYYRFRNIRIVNQVVEEKVYKGWIEVI